MADNLKYIDDLVRNVLEHRMVNSPDQSWETLEKKIPVPGFWQFNLRRFNIYYLSSITAAILILLFILTYIPGNDVTLKYDKNDSGKIALSNTEPGVPANSNINAIAPKDTIGNEKNTVPHDNIAQPEYVNEQQNINEKKNKSLKSNIRKLFKQTNPVSESVQPVSYVLKDFTVQANEQKIEEEKNVQNQLEYFVREKFDIPQLTTLGLNIGNTDFRIAIPDTSRKFNLLFENLELSQQNSRYYAELFFSPLYTYNQLTAKNGSYEELMTERKNLEKPLVSYSVGGNFYYMLTNSVFLQTGLAYSRLGEKFSKGGVMSIDSATVSLADSNTVWFYNIDSFYVGIYDSIPYTYATGTYHTEMNYDSTFKNSVSSINRFSYLEIPIILGYQFNRPRFSYSVKAGIITGFLLNASGKSLSTGDAQTIEDINSNMLFKKPVFSYTFGTGISYQITERFYLTGEAYYRKSFTSIFKEYPLIQKYETYGLRLGIRYGF